jgi:hypothetical protein
MSAAVVLLFVSISLPSNRSIRHSITDTAIHYLKLSSIQNWAHSCKYSFARVTEQWRSFRRRLYWNRLFETKFCFVGLASEQNEKAETILNDISSPMAKSTPVDTGYVIYYKNKHDYNGRTTCVYRICTKCIISCLERYTAVTHVTVPTIN